MSINKLKPSLTDLENPRVQETQLEVLLHILEQLERINNYLALMTDEVDPPDEYDSHHSRP